MKMSNQKRILEIEKELTQFIGLNIGKFAYCENSNDFIIASYFNNSIKSCIEVTKYKSKFKDIHRKLNIFHSYCLELKQLGGL